MLGKYGLMEFNAVCSHRAITASTAICFFGSGDDSGDEWLELPLGRYESAAEVD